jgi:hypothetical protein
MNKPPEENEHNALIEQIKENDILIQCHVEEDNPKSVEELNGYSTDELIHHIQIQEARLKFLIEDDDDNVVVDKHNVN